MLLARPAQMVHQASQDNKEIVAGMAFQVPLVLLVQMEDLETQAVKVPEVRMVLPELLGLPE